MKWLTPVLPYLAVGLGLFWFQNAWIALLGFHCAIRVALWLAKANIPIKILLKSSDIRWIILSGLLCGSSGLSLYFLWKYFGVAVNITGQMEALGLTRATWPVFIAYFVCVNPFIEEYFWRGYLGSSTSNLYLSDFLYAGFHGLI